MLFKGKWKLIMIFIFINLWNAYKILNCTTSVGCIATVRVIIYFFFSEGKTFFILDVVVIWVYVIFNLNDDGLWAMSKSINNNKNKNSCVNKIIQIDFNNQPIVITGFAFLIGVWVVMALTLWIIIKSRQINLLNELTKQKMD